MKSKASLTDAPILFDLDLRRTERPDSQDGAFYWEGDTLVNTGRGRFNMVKALLQLSPPLKASFKQNLILFSTHGDYAPNSYSCIFSALLTSLNAHPTSSFDTSWMARALTNPSFHRSKRGITELFLHWQERDSAAISQEALSLLNDTASLRAGPRNVLSDDPKKSWLTEEEYDGLLRKV